MKKIILVVLGAIISAFLITAVVTLLVLDTTQRAVAPILNANSNMSTEVAKILNPTPTILADPVTVIHDVRSLARLETIQYSIEKVITGDTGQTIFAPLFGDKLLFVAHGTVIAGVDLEKVMPGDLKVENGILQFRLPEAEIFSATLDNEKSYVFDRQTGVLTHGNPDLETQVRRAAEQEIYKAAVSDGILAQARLNAENYLTRLLNDLGFRDVIFLTATPMPDD